MTADPSVSPIDPAAPGAGATDAHLDALAERAAAWVSERRGLLTFEMASCAQRGSLLDRLGARLPALCRWARTRAPQSAADIAMLLLEADVSDPAAVYTQIERAVREAATSDVWTVLAVNDADEAGDEALALLDRLAGLEPMMQLVLVGRPGFIESAAPDSVAQRLALRVRQRIPVAIGAIEAPQPIAAPPALVPASTDPTTPASPRSLPADFDRSTEPDPFRDAPASLTLDSPALLPVLSAPHSAHSEWFRILRLRLEDWVRNSGGGPRTLMVTGPDVATGKSFVSVNLALLWAQSTGERVLLVDGDLRRPQFHALFEIPRRPGLADLLSRRADVHECNAFISEVGLHVMPAGRPGNPRHLMNPEHVQPALDKLKASFDLVIVDSPPLGSMVDSRSMAAAADGVLMVVRAGITRFQTLQQAIDFLPADNLVGTVLNAGAMDADSAYAKYQRAAAG